MRTEVKKLRWTICNMKQRCNNSKNIMYKSYGKRGIKICEEWNRSSEKFVNWSLENGYEEGLSLDRIDNDKGYEPGNCRWTTQSVQTRNVRTICKSNTTGYKGVSLTSDKLKFRANIMVNLKNISLGVWIYALDAAKAYDYYVLSNKLEHSVNNVLEKNEEIDIFGHKLLSDANKSGYLGVSKRKSGKWTSRIRVNGKYLSLGSFDSPLEAAVARDRYIIKNKMKNKLNGVA